MNAQAFKIERVTSVERVVELWPFFLEGLEELNKLVRNGDIVSPGTLLRTLLHVVSLHENNGLVLVIKSKNDKPLLWGAALDNTALFKPRTCVVYAVYSNKKADGVVAAAIQYFESWARASGFTRIQAFSPCFNGSRFRLFEQVWKFQRSAVVFSKEL